MPVTMKQVRAALDPEEPDYAKAAKLGPGALPHLEKLIGGKDPGLASKAASLAGMVGDERAARVLEKAARHKDVRVRVAAAHSAQYLPPLDASRILSTLLADDDVGVQKVALKSVARGVAVTAELRSSVETLAKRQAHPAIRDLSSEVLARLSR
jgi:HEAT repeat protein